ncbi:MAG: 30S ribosomal protein S20 [Dehalococcoidales bacterium]|nr:30S ribosomal protein S20 [Dehalococcoidales bacterium]
MPNIKSAERAMRVSRKKHLHNQAIKSEVKTKISNAESLILAGKAEAKDAATAAISSLDKAAEKGVIHRNNAARRKSRLARKLNKTLAQGTSETKPESAK